MHRRGAAVMPPSPSADDRLKTLKALIKERSFSDDREVTLASGRKSWLYFNMKPTMLEPEGAYLIAELILDALADVEVDVVGGMEIGGVPLVSTVAAASFVRGRPLKAFFIRKKMKEHGARKRVEGLAPGETLEGKKVVMLEDVTTTGGSILDAIGEVESAGGKVMSVVTIIDRQEGAEAALKARGFALHALLRADEFTDKK
jgi:orotate phosphoribosyltransferase